MSLSLLFPTALTGLLAVAVPLLIHLARRQQHTPLPFAALRWLQRDARPRQQIRLNEWLLLLLRLLLVIAFVLLLAQPQWHGESAQAKPVVAVAPTLAGQPLPADLPADAQRVWLAPGFPPLDQPTPTDAQPTSSLLRELDAQMPANAELSVVVPPVVQGADGEVPILARHVDWRVLPVENPQPDADAAAAAATAPRWVIRHDDAAEGLRYLRATQRAWQPEGATDIEADTVGLPALEPSQWVVWLSAAPLPAAATEHLRRGGGLLLDHRQPVDAAQLRVPRLLDAQGRAVIEQLPGAGRVLRFARPLNATAVPMLLDAEFPHRLREVLAPAPMPSVADAVDTRPRHGGMAATAAPRDLSSWLMLLICGLLLAERLLATTRKRQGAP